MISPTAEYALRAMVAIAQGSGDAVVTPAIAEITKVPPGYLPKVLQTLRKAGLVDSKRGLGGGFTLARPAEDVTVLEVVNAVDPIKRIHRCPLGIDSHGTNLCPLHQRLDQATELVEKSFASTSNLAKTFSPATPSVLPAPTKRLRARSICRWTPRSRPT